MIAFRQLLVNPVMQSAPAVEFTPALSLAARCELAHLHRGALVTVTMNEDYVTCRAHAELVAHRLAKVEPMPGRDGYVTVTPLGRRVFAALAARDSGLRLLGGESLSDQVVALEQQPGGVCHG